ncbi:reverse transcriptase [Penicillium coprophilum]|uniref:reverse transcriptase n=1 Tax=Penicillium coprophilum TaxID=36646 RepID=UPI002392A171|nr:reverse transcriptase [Penicillium coprophilum]KAJ5158253.1 reverse transcriptase [Penicillium coprophilum]
MAHGALPQTLKSITATKINELSKQRALFDLRKTEILAHANAAPDLQTRAQALLDGISRLKGYPKDSLDKNDADLDADSSDEETEKEKKQTSRGIGRWQLGDHTNMRHFLLQSRYDPSISQKALQDRITQLENELRYLEIKHEHGEFYSKLVTEWLSELDGSISTAADDASFEKAGRAEMREQRAQWESLVFTPATHVNEDAIQSYLNDLFTKSKLSQQALKDLRASIQSFGTELSSSDRWFDVDTLDWVSKALLKTDLLGDEKRGILKDCMRNEEVAQEIADVLNMRIASLDSWTWTDAAGGISVEFRRQLNGKYRAFMDEDLLDALLLQYLGTTWAVKLREVFEAFLRSNAWTNPHEDIPEDHKEMRKYFLGRDANSESGKVNKNRRQTYTNDYFMSQLPTSTDEGTILYDEENSESRNVLDTKHSLLHLLITESIIHKHQHGEFTAIRSDFEWFGPSMPHVTLLAVLRFFGVSESWLKFFVVFLEAPLKFAQDGPDAFVKVRRRGLPMSHTLGDCFGESVLFCMDYAVNKATDGAFLYRLHDDFWFWGAENTCVKAWEAMEEFTQVMGLKFNQQKTGTVRMGAKKTSTESTGSVLPTGDIRWGFLVLDEEQERFIIDQAQVDTHIEELSRQLSSCKSVFAWVQAWNSYFGRFFTNNFAKPAMCFGRDHIDMAISTLSRIERTLFCKVSDDKSASAQISGVTDYLRNVIADRFGIHNLPDGFFYYPVELGGLELLNPYIGLLAMRENIKYTPQKLFREASLKDEKEYEEAKEKFKKDGADPSSQFWSKWSNENKPFMSFEDFTRYPETFNASLEEVYEELTDVPIETCVQKTGGFEREQNSLGKQFSECFINPMWGKMTPYWCWVAELYCEEMVRTYGGLAAVNRGFMPLGIVKTLCEGKFRWQG